ncbi:hypothetical protein [Citrobacter portucalensis]|uniref:hypothetical protein n=1 Tax=Enterobacteriaceae TaxID=543 RepID=UPI003979677C
MRCRISPAGITNTIRVLSMDPIQKTNSGHQGVQMDMDKYFRLRLIMTYTISRMNSGARYQSVYSSQEGW